MTLPTFAALGYLLGSLPFAVIISRAFGLADPRSFGSGNPGATNVLRSGNKLAAALTLIADALKGWFAMWLARHFGGDSMTIAVVGFAAFIGHVFPLFLKFKGGKGAATALGVLTGFSSWLGLAIAAIWLLVVVTTRYSSLAALVAAAVAPLAALWLGVDEAALTEVGAMTVVLILRHRQNIQRLLAGTEGKLGAAKKAD